jgi:hypothetical protein
MFFCLKTDYCMRSCFQSSECASPLCSYCCLHCANALAVHTGTRSFDSLIVPCPRSSMRTCWRCVWAMSGSHITWATIVLGNECTRSAKRW